MKIEIQNVTKTGSARLAVTFTEETLHRFALVLKRNPAQTQKPHSPVAMARPGRNAACRTIETHTMKKTLILTTLALGLSAAFITAQDTAPQRPDGPPPGGRPGGPRGEGMRPNLPILSALDANKDGLIDANEIANAAAALKTLDKNGDGQLTHDEMMPQRPEGAGNPGEGRPPGRGRPGAGGPRPPVEQQQ